MNFKKVYHFIKPPIIYFSIYLAYYLIDFFEGGGAQMCGPTLSILFLILALPITALTLFIVNVVNYLSTKSKIKLYNTIFHGVILAFILILLF